MNTDNLIPIDFSRNITPFVFGDLIWDRHAEFKLTLLGAELRRFNCKNEFGGEYYVISFANRPNTGKQPVDDDVRVDITYTQGSIEDIDAGSLKWLTEAADSYFAKKSWKPNHAAMLARYQSEQGAKQMNYAEQETELATHYSANNNCFYIQESHIDCYAMVLDDAGRWTYSDCTTNDELDGDEFWKLDANKKADSGELPNKHIELQAEEVGNQSDLDIVISPDEPVKELRIGSPVEPYEWTEKHDEQLKSAMVKVEQLNKPVFTQAMADAGELPQENEWAMFLADETWLKCKYIGINKVGSKSYAVCWSPDKEKYVDSKLNGSVPIRFKPIGNRSEGQKLRDAATESLAGYLGDLCPMPDVVNKAVEWHLTQLSH